jgi:hypothetical protein
MTQLTWRWRWHTSGMTNASMSTLLRYTSRLRATMVMGSGGDGDWPPPSLLLLLALACVWAALPSLLLRGRGQCRAGSGWNSLASTAVLGGGAAQGTQDTAGGGHRC